MADFIKKHKHALILGGIGLGVLLFFSSKARTTLDRGEDFIEEEFTDIPTYQSLMRPRGKSMKGQAISKAMAAYMNRANPGITDFDNNVNQVPGAAGSQAGLDPSEYSYLTQRNRNPLLSNMGYAGHMLTGGPARNFENIRFQGSWGLVGPPGQGFNTYF